MIELGIGTAAGLHFVAATKMYAYQTILLERLYKDDVIKEKFELKDGCLEVPDGEDWALPLMMRRLRSIEYNKKFVKNVIKNFRQY